MPYQLTCRLPIIRLKIRMGPITLNHLEEYFSCNFEPWPRAIPKELEVKALIDTGASVSIIDSAIVEMMQLCPHGYCSISGFDSPLGDSGHAKEYPNYEVGLSLLKECGDEPLLTIHTGQIVGHFLNNPRFDAIIGMDVLKHCNFYLCGPNDTFEIAAPVGFVEEISSVSVSDT